MWQSAPDRTRPAGTRPANQGMQAARARVDAALRAGTTEKLLPHRVRVAWLATTDDQSPPRPSGPPVPLWRAPALRASRATRRLWKATPEDEDSVPVRRAMLAAGSPATSSPSERRQERDPGIEVCPRRPQPAEVSQTPLRVPSPAQERTCGLLPPHDRQQWTGGRQRPAAPSLPPVGGASRTRGAAARWRHVRTAPPPVAALASGPPPSGIPGEPPSAPPETTARQ